MSKQPTVEELFEKYKSLSPKERNERLQALFAASLEGRGEPDDFSLELMQGLMRSFDISVKFEELEDNDGTDAF